MSELREHYGKLGYKDFDRLEKKPSYLNELASFAAVEMDDY